MQLLKRLVVEEDGQGITEYALMLGLVILGIWIAVKQSGIGNSITAIFTAVKNQTDLCAGGNCGG